MNSLSDGSATTLSDAPAYGGGSIYGGAAWAYQWDVALNTGDTYLISKDKRMSEVPEPGALLLLGLVLAGGGVLRWRRKAS